jgi:hypothetical protein
MRFFSLLLLLSCTAFITASAQKVLPSKTSDVRDYMYKREASFGARILTNGVAVYGEYGWIKDIYKTHLLQVEYQYFIDYAQKRQQSPRESGRDFTFGVQNRFHALHLSYTYKRSIADKARVKGVHLSFIAVGGFSLGLLKPYYLNLLQLGDGGPPTFEPERYSEANSSRFLSLDSILEAAPIRYGLNQMQPVPGVHAKFGLNFDWGSKDQFVKALECGAMLDLYYKRVPILVNNSNRFYRIGLYLSFQFGKRW